LFSALELESRVGVSTALEQMGVVSLCPVTENQFPRMELVAGRLVGPARIIPLVELAHFAAEFGDFGRAQKYTEEARTFDPTSWELYSLCVVEGLIAFNTGDIRGAIWQLDKSINACQMDENAHLSSAVYGPNLALARKLLVYGERLEVLRHLMKCKDVWHLCKAYFDKWITQIEGGETGEFLASEVFEQMNQPSYRLKVQWMSACSLGGCSSSPRPSSSHPAS